MSFAVVETISTPNGPSGPATGKTDSSYSFTDSGSSSNVGHTLQYQFDWKGDETDLSSWGAATQSKTWTVAATYNVRTRARCITHTSIFSDWSEAGAIEIIDDKTPPTPNPMTWATPPYETGINSISMVATTATDPTDSVSYYFDFVSSPTGGTGGTDSGWQSSTTCTDTGLQAN